MRLRVAPIPEIIGPDGKGNYASQRRFTELIRGIGHAINTIGDNVLGWADVRDYPSINAAVASINSTSKTLVVSNTQPLAANLTIPANIALVVLKGGLITKASTYTLAVNGAFEAGLYQAFSGFSAGDVTFGAGVAKEVYPEWWGIDGVADEIEINSSAASISSGIIRLQSKTYTIAGSIKLYSYQELQGSGQETIISANLTASLVQELNKDNGQFIKVRNLKIDNTSKLNAGSVGIDFTGVGNSIIEDVWVNNVETAIRMAYATTGYYNTITVPHIRNVINGIVSVSGNSSNIFGGSIGTCDTGISIASSQVGVYGTAIEIFADYGINLNASGICTLVNPRLENALAVGTGIYLGATASSNNIVSPYFGSMATYIDDQSGNTSNQYQGDESYYGWKTYSPTVTSGAGAITAYTATGRYLRAGKRVFLQLKITITTKGTAAGAMIITLPTTARDTVYYTIIPFMELVTSLTTGAGNITPNSTTLQMVKYDFTTPFVANGDVWHGSGWYETE